MKRLLIVNNAEKEIYEYVRRFPFIFKDICQTNIVNYSEIIKLDTNIYSGIILSGSPRGNDIIDHHIKYYHWLKDTDVPILGICAGHHIIGRLWNAEIIRSEQAEFGYFPVYPQLEHSIFNNNKERILVRQLHNDSISLPEGFTHLAKSEICYNQAMKHPEKEIYSFQFHPEYITDKLLLNWWMIINNFNSK